MKTQADWFPTGSIILTHTLWEIWKERNDSFFQGRASNPLATISKINLALYNPEDQEPLGIKKGDNIVK